MYTTQNSLKRAHTDTKTQRESTKKQLTIHLQIDQLTSEQLLEVVNKNREILNLDPISELSPQTQIDLGLVAQNSTSRFNKTSAAKSIEAMNELMAKFDDLGKTDAKHIVKDIARLQQDAALLTMIQQRSLIEKGLELVQGPDCPLCDHTWPDEEHLKAHLASKIDKSMQADKITKRLLDNASNLAQHITEITTNLLAIHQIASLKEISATEDAKVVDTWRQELAELKSSLSSIDKILFLKDRLDSGWLNIPAKFDDNINNVGHLVNAKPDQTAIVAAQTFLSTAQVRLADYRKAGKKHEQAEKSAHCSKLAYDIYCEVMEAELNALYEDVQADFSTYYRELNGDDEATFHAKFTPSEGALALDVNFYGRGLFPPGAYHSEGHQDGMGVCLYLALMKRLFGERFSFALLDDVVMSVDSGHRYQFCKLLQTNFPDTQFILTTHDRLWAKQMNSAKLVSSKNSLVFHSWSVDTGPLVESSEEIWEDIATALDKGKVEAAAHSLRRHLEYFANHQCDQLGAHPQFRADGNYDLGVLLPAAQNE